MRVECKCMKFVAADWCTSGEILLLVIRPVVLGLKKTGLVHLPDLFEGKREKEQCDFIVCVERLWMIGLMVVLLMSYLRVVSVVLVLWRVGPVLGKGYWI